MRKRSRVAPRSLPLSSGSVSSTQRRRPKPLTGADNGKTVTIANPDPFGAYDSAIIYFTNVIERWPHVPRARDALLRLAESYRAIRYREELDETCTRLRQTYPNDGEVAEICRGTRMVADTASARPIPESTAR